MTLNGNFDAAWQAVLAADSSERQRQQIDAFLALNREAGAPPLQVSVKEVTSGETVAIGKALWENPQAYEVTLRYDGRSYAFVPQSRASLEPLFRE